MICYAVIDTNVLVSALLSPRDDSATVQVIEKVLAGEIIPIYSNDISHEYRDVLSRKKFNFPPYLVEFLITSIEDFGILINSTITDITLPDIKDVPFYKVVLEKRDDNAYLVTGNIKHFPHEPFVVTPRELLDLLN